MPTNVAIEPGPTLRNILLLLQHNPASYRCFGIWWWPIKALLKGLYTRDQLYLLGDYQDDEVASLASNAVLGDLPATLTAALEEYALNVRYNLNGNIVQDPDGQNVQIYDADAGL